MKLLNTLSTNNAAYNQLHTNYPEVLQREKRRCDGGSQITDAGAIWSTNPNLTIALSTKISVPVRVDVNSGYILLSGLTPKTTYYNLTYATNSVGTTYNNNLAGFFTTL